MGTLQSFTPLPRQTFRLLLYNPSEILLTTIQSAQFRKEFRFESKEILDTKSQKCNKKQKILIEAQNLVKVINFVPIFHHQIIIIRKQGQKNYVKINSEQKQIKFQIHNLGSQQLYNPFQVQSLKLCQSISIGLLIKFTEIVKNKQSSNHSKIYPPVKQNYLDIQQTETLFHQNKSKILKNQTNQANISTQNLLEIQKSHQTFHDMSPNKPNVHHTNCLEEIRTEISKILFCHHFCTFNPVSLILCTFPASTNKKIMNLLIFYEANFIRYPSLETFLSSGCNSKSIICGPTQLQQIIRNVQMGLYPFQKSKQASFFSNSNDELMGNSNELYFGGLQRVNKKVWENQPTFIYCFAKTNFQHYFMKTQEKKIGVLRDKSIQIKFFTNLLQLIKQLFIDQNKTNSNQLYAELNLDKKSSGVNRKRKTQRGTVGNINEDHKDAFNSTNNPDNFSKTFQDYSHLFQAVHESIVKKQSYSPDVKMKKKESKQTISNIGSSKLDQGLEFMRKTFSIIPKLDRILTPSIGSTVYFFIHEKQKDRYMVQSLSKKIGRHLKHLKLKKIHNFDELCKKMQNHYVTPVLINDNPKILQQFYTAVEAYSSQDKVVVIKRSQTDTEQILVKKIKQFTETGMMRVQKFCRFSSASRKFIVIGSKSYLKHIVSMYPFLSVKEFVDVNLFQEQRKIRQVISRKNQFIISSFPICNLCNLQYQGILRSKIIYYNPFNQNNLQKNIQTDQNCICRQKNFYRIFQQQNENSLEEYLENFSFLKTTYPYENKKIWQASVNLEKLFSKIKQKKYLINDFDKLQHQSEILFICADSWVIEQITMETLQIFNSRYTGIILCDWMKNKLIYDCIQQGKNLVDIHVKSFINIVKENITTIGSRLIEQSREIYIKMTEGFQKASDIFDFSSILLNLMIENTLFRKSINYAWKTLLSLNNHEYPFKCATIFLFLLLGFRRASSLKKNDSINDGTFKSFIKFTTQLSDSRQTCSFSIDNFKPSLKQSNKIKNKSLQKPQNMRYSDSSYCQSINLKTQEFIDKNLPFKPCDFIDPIKEQKCQKQFENLTPKIYLKLCDFQKPQEESSLRKFFLSKNNVYSYIYTTQFLVFEMIDPSEIDQILPIYPQKLEKTSKNNIQIKKFQQKSNYSPKLINYRQRHNDNALNRPTSDQKGQRNYNKRNEVKIQYEKPSKQVQSALNNIAPIISSFFSFQKTQKEQTKKDKEIKKQSFVLGLKSCKNIEMLASTEETLIICIENIQLLTYTLFIPYYRGQSQSNKKKKFLLPPFTKLQINTNYQTKNLLTNATSSLMTHQLRLSPDYQQKFIQKFLEKFLVQQSQYYQDLPQNQKIQILNIFDSLGSDLKQESKNSKNEDTLIAKNKNRQLSMKKVSSNLLKKTQSTSKQKDFIQERFSLPEADKFFILMNEFKYFSAHNLLISSLPQTNMTNAYHAILLTRKGLYQEAINVLAFSNPYRFSIEEYIRHLKMRVDEISQQKRLKQSTKLVQIKPKVMKWKLNFESKTQKFYLRSKNVTDFSFCYNDDSLDVVYKQVLTNIQNGIQRGSYQKSTKNQRSDFMNSKLYLGNMTDSKGSVRKEIKQSSIAINVQLSQNSSERAEQNLFMGLVQQTLVDLQQTRNSSIKQRKSLKKQENLKKFLLNSQSTKNDGRRGSRISMSSSEFLFQNIPNVYKQIFQNQHLNNVKRFSMDRKTVKEKIPRQSTRNLKENQCKPPLTNRSKSSEQSEKFIRKRNKKVSSIIVKTRFKSNFFRQNVQELKKLGYRQNTQQKQFDKEIIYSEKSSSKDESWSDQKIACGQQGQNQRRTSKYQKQSQFGLKSSDLKGQFKVLQQENKKNHQFLFKHFKSQKEIFQQEQLKEQDKKLQSLEQLTFKEKKQIKKDENQIKIHDADNSNEMNFQNSSKNLSKGSFNYNNQVFGLNSLQKKNQAKINKKVNEISQQELQENSQTIQSDENDDLIEGTPDLTSQQSDMFGDTDRNQIFLNLKIKKKKSKLKSKFTLQLSSESSSEYEETRKLATQKNNHQIQQIHSTQSYTYQQISYSEKIRISLQDYPHQHSQKNQLKDKSHKNIIKSPYKAFSQYLSCEDSQILQQQEIKIYPPSPENSQKQKNPKKKDINMDHKEERSKQFKRDKSLLNFKFKKKSPQKKNQQKEQTQVINHEYFDFAKRLEKNQQKQVQKVDKKHLVRKSKQKSKQDKNTFTFMKPQNQHLNCQKSDIQGKFVEKNPSFQILQVNLKRKASILARPNQLFFNTKNSEGNQVQNSDRNSDEGQQVQSRFKIYPQELIGSKINENNSILTHEEMKINSPKSLESQHKLDLASLKKLKLNCDIRRKR